MEGFNWRVLVVMPLIAIVEVLGLVCTAAMAVTKAAVAWAAAGEGK